MASGIDPTELSAAVGGPDYAAMELIRDRCFARDPLVDDVSFDDPISPRELQVRFVDGFDGADTARLDVTWYAGGAYRFHYVDEAINWRFDRHPNPHSPEKHFHEPPDADSETAVASCITVEEPVLVARAVLQLWRRAYETGSLAELNTAENPP
ncbi:hypothetical protein [Haloparvum sedimenti]|uniref:hypothetical protein n=1 Tax=Haloparvum sedimenti TaxID=1678448 RepID=UPI00071E7078|nr:hypothetical protein [Haloparvum sedimenti]